MNKLAQPESYVSQLLDATASDQRRLSKEVAVQLGWTLRGLLLRNHPQLVRVVRRVLEVLRSGEPGVADQVNSCFKRLRRISKKQCGLSYKTQYGRKYFYSRYDRTSGVADYDVNYDAESFIRQKSTTLALYLRQGISFKSTLPLYRCQLSRDLN